MSKFHGPAVGRWLSLKPQDAATLLADVNRPWWIAGGWALDLFLGCQTRVHEDLDVGIVRRDVVAVMSYLRGWEFFAAQSQRLHRLEAGECPNPDVNSLWCRPAQAQHWSLELMLDDEQGGDWVFRRSRAIRMPLDSAIQRTSTGVPYLRPEIQLLYKAGRPRPKDHGDFERVLPLLEPAQRAWLRAALSTFDPGHVWLAKLGGR